jgi:hypothetical protein
MAFFKPSEAAFETTSIKFLTIGNRHPHQRFA